MGNGQTNQSASEEALWVVAIRTGDAIAFEMLFKRYCQALISFSRRIVEETAIAENIVQDVFLHLWENRDRLDEQQSIKSYLYKSVMNHSLKHLRHLKVRASAREDIISSIEPVETPEDIHGAAEMSVLIRKAISKLPQKCRTIFSMNRFDGLTYAQIAEVLDISIKTVETQMGRALIFLRKRLQHMV